MSIIRVRKSVNYFTASNEPFLDKRLSWETRGLMGYLLTKPDSWEVRVGDLEKQGPAKLHKIRRMLAEARLYGYMNRIRVTKPDGTFDWITEVFESVSQNPNPSSSVRKSTTGLSSVRLSTSGSSTSGKPADIVSTEESITKDLMRGILENEAKVQAKTNPLRFFEEALGFGILPWDSRPDLRALANWICTMKDDLGIFKDYATWRNGSGRFRGAMTNLAIRRDPRIFMDTGWPTFLAHSAMYPNGDSDGRKNKSQSKQESNRRALEAAS